MLTHLTLQAIQKLVNTALKSDAVATQFVHTNLVGKRLRMVTLSPNMAIDCDIDIDGKLYLEPSATLQNKQVGDFYRTPFDQPEFNLKQLDGQFILLADATLSVATLSELIPLLNAEGGNLPIKGDYKVLQHVLGLIRLIEIDVTALLAPIMGSLAAGQVQAALVSLKTGAKKSSSRAQFLASEWLEDSALFASKRDLNEFGLQLVNLNTDIERLEARLARLNQE